MGHTILRAALLIKILLTAGAFILCFWKFNIKSKWKQRAVPLILLCLAFAGVSHKVSDSFPSMTDDIKLTALDEGCPEAQSTEVLLAGYTIDGKNYIAGKSMEIKEDHWFWTGETYIWRPENDPRQPDGVTRSVTVRIPVGWERTLDFVKAVYAGKVQIESNGENWVVDNYASEQYSVGNVELGRSTTTALIKNQIYKLAIYAAAMSLLLLGVFAISAIIAKRKFFSYEKLEQYDTFWIAASIAVIVAIPMIYFADKTSLTFDEMYQIYSASGTLKDAVENCLFVRNCFPPLYEIVGWAWYHIVPYGERWLLLVSIMSTLLAIILIALGAQKIYGKACGILAAILMSTSSIVWSNTAYEFRAYPFLLLFSTLVLYCYVQRNKEQKFLKWKIFYSVALAGLAMTHYFGMLLCGIYFLADLYLLVKRQIKWGMGLVYVFPGVLSLGWLGAVYYTTLSHKRPEEIVAWYPIPDFYKIADLFHWLTDYQELLYWILFLSIAFAIVTSLKNKTELYSWKIFYNKLFVVAIISIIFGIFLYGNIINRKSTLWNPRYFIIMLPFTFTLSAEFLSNIGKWFEIQLQKQIILNRLLCVFFGVMFFINCLSTISTQLSYEPYREAADWLYSQTDIFNKETVIIAQDGAFIDGSDINIDRSWNEYYITRQGRRNSLNIIESIHLTEQDMQKYDKVYCQYAYWFSSYFFLPWLQKYLDENFDLVLDNSEVHVRYYVRKQ